MTEPMRALVLHAVGDVRLEKIPRPAARPGCVLVRVGFCGVCGSDIPRIFVKGTYSFPTVCGHEFAGVVEECGEGVEDVRPGDRVAVFPLLWCGRCAPCERGMYAQCLNYDYLGSRSDGAFAEHVVAPEANLLKVPAGVTLEEAAMTEPAAVALHAVNRGGGCGPGEVVAVFGTGPIGLMAAQWARAMGASRVILLDVAPRKLELARRLGFAETLDSRAGDPVRALEERTGGEGVHLSIEAAGVPDTLLQAVASTCRGGRVVLLGNPAADVELPAALLSQAMRREISLFGSWNSQYSSCSADDDWHTTLQAMADKSLDLLPLITHRVSLEQSKETLCMMREQREFYAKVLVHP